MANKSPSKSKKRSAAKRQQTSANRKTKKQTCIDLLGRPKGAGLAELQRATGWQAHSVRGFLSGTVKKLVGVTLVSDQTDNGERRYRIEKAS